MTTSKEKKQYSHEAHPEIQIDTVFSALYSAKVIKFYCKRGLMENFIKESSHTRIVNANRLQVHALAYNIFNWFRRLALSANMRKQRIDTVRLKLLKIAAKVVRSARYITFKLYSSCPYKNEFYETLSNIGKLNVQLE